MKDIKSVLNNITKLPPMPKVMSKILRISEDTSASAQDIIDIIQYDQNITANILRLCNSSYYCQPRQISSLNEAVVMLGNKVLYRIILTSFTENMLGKKNPGYEIEKGKLWEHSISCAILSKEIAHKVKLQNVEMAYSIGLLHDTGKVVLDKFISNSAHEIIDRLNEGDTDFNKIEEEIIGMSHAQVGAVLAENWKFPEELISGIRYHHTPEEATEHEKLVYIIHLADALAIMFGFGSGIDGLSYHLSDKTFDVLSLTERDIYAYSPFLVNEVKKVNELLNTA